MRIALLMNLSPRKLGSLEAWVVGMAREAHRRGHAVDVFGREPAHPEVARALHSLGAGWTPVDWLEESRLRGIRRLSSYDVLHLTLFQARDPAALMAYAAWPARVLLMDQTSGRRRGPSTPLREAKAALGRIADRVSLVRVTHLAGVSNYVRDRDRRRFGLGPNQARTIYNGVDAEHFAPRREANAPPEAASIVAVAYLIPEKGIDVLLRAMARMRRSHTPATIVGDGPESERLRALAAELGLEERVRFTGLRDDVSEQLNRGDIYVHPAVWEEAFGLTITEAMATERAVIASRAGGIPEIIRHGQDGLLVNPGDVDALAEALDFLVERPEERMRLARNARRRVLEQFDLRACVDEHLAWVERAMDAPGPRRAPAPGRAPAWPLGGARSRSALCRAR